MLDTSSSAPSPVTSSLDLRDDRVAGSVAARDHLITYYEAFERLLAPARRAFGDARTHFGLLRADELPEGYCFFATIADPWSRPGALEVLRRGMDRLHERLFAPLGAGYRGRILDVGFGAGGTLARLAGEHPEAALAGVNINPVQHAIAREALAARPNVALRCADFFDAAAAPAGPFDLLYFIESAFHMVDKRRLCQRIAASLRPGGELFVVDVFLAEAAARRAGTRQVAAEREGIFDYRDLATWRELLAEHGLRITDFDDLSAEVVPHITITTPRGRAREELFGPRVAGLAGREELLARLDEAYVGYRRLGRLLDRGFLRYGILRAVKDGGAEA